MKINNVLLMRLFIWEWDLGMGNGIWEWDLGFGNGEDVLVLSHTW